MATNTLPASSSKKPQGSSASSSTTSTRTPPKRSWEEYKDLSVLKSILEQYGSVDGLTVEEVVSHLQRSENASCLEIIGADRSSADLAGVVETGLDCLVREAVVDMSTADRYLLFPKDLG